MIFLLKFYKNLFCFTLYLGGGGSSSADTATETNTTTNNASLQGTDGIAIIGSDNTVTDHGAIESSMNTAQRALDAIYGTSRDAFGTFNAVNENNNLLLEHALDTNAQFYDETLDLVSQSQTDVLAYADKVTTNALGFVNNLSNPTQANTSEALKYATYGGLALLAYKAIK